MRTTVDTGVALTPLRDIVQPSASPLQGVRLACLVTCLLVIHYCFAYTATLYSCTTYDEPLHVAAGFSYWTLNDYRLQPENGNLPQRWCAIPLLYMNQSFPPLQQQGWYRSDALALGRQFLYDCGNDSTAMLQAARAMAALWSTAVCLVVFLWAKTIYNTSAALLSLLLAVFWPALVAHGPLATSDACGALFLTLGGWALWNLLIKVTVGTMLSACVAVGLALLAKHSCLMLGPLACLYVAGTCVIGCPVILEAGGLHYTLSGRVKSTLARVLILFVPAAAAFLFIWASCGFRFDAAAPGCGPVTLARYETLEACGERAGVIGQLCTRLAAWRLLPEAWLYGVCYVVVESQMRPAFALGYHSIGGWWWYFPLCLLVKNTLPSLVLVFGGIVVTLTTFARVRLPPPGCDVAPFKAVAPLSIVVLLWAALLNSNLNIGERHLLPAYPAMIIMIGGLLREIGHKWMRLVLFTFVFLHVADVASGWPYSLAYFNQFVPPGKAHEWLIDSNLDWGQDFSRLKHWLRWNARDDEPIFLSYFGSCVEATRSPGITVLGKAPRPGQLQKLSPGLYCVSATHIEGIDVEPTGWWAKAFEEIYARSRAFVEGDRSDDHTARLIIQAAKAERWGATADQREVRTPADAVAAIFNTAQAGRLRSWLRCRDPLTVIGGSILVFRLSAEDLTTALDGAPSELRPLSWEEEISLSGVAPIIARADRCIDVGNLAVAEQLLRTAVRLDPNEATAWDRLGITLAANGRFREADAAFRKASRLAPLNPHPLYNRGLLLMSQGWDDEALTAFDQATRQAPHFPDPYLQRALIRVRSGNEAGAREDLQAFLRLGGTLPPDLQHLKQFLLLSP